MSPVTRNVISIPAGYASQEVASFIAQLDDQLRRQKEQTRTLTPPIMLEHFAAHFGQILLLQHARQAGVEVIMEFPQLIRPLL